MAWDASSSQTGGVESRSLLERLQRLPGFDNAAFIKAMSGTGDEKFVCWRRMR